MLIIALIIVTTIIQGYYIVEDYLENKRLFIQEVQQSLDNSLEIYFAEQAKSDVLNFVDIKGMDIQLQAFTDTVLQVGDTMQFFDRFNSSKMVKKHLNFIKNIQKGNSPVIDTTAKTIKLDTLKTEFAKISMDSENHVAAYFGTSYNNSQSAIKNLTEQIVISIIRDSLDLPKLTKLLEDELERNQLRIRYALYHREGDVITNSFQSQNAESLPLKAISKSTYLPLNQEIQLTYENSSLIILRKGIGRIAFGLFFILLVSGVLAYLYRVIKSQKELSEIKNDLINNITHEFKTPIATVSAAVEGIRSFNQQNDPEKTKRYLDISTTQLNKLHLMVERLLETATLDSEKLLLSPELVNLKPMLLFLQEKFQTLTNKVIITKLEEVPDIEIDIFHFENAVSNLLDNAIKYGGNEISLILRRTSQVEIIVQDNGHDLPKNQLTKIFEKFYRIPKGNVHDTRGFGIGLYYSKNIIEKHRGTLTATVDDSFTTFKIALP